jgi:simple sugar transport system ATP-binding protein
LRNGRVVVNQERPIDLAAAIKAMIGRDLGRVGPRSAVASSARTILKLDRVRLTANAKPFDLSIRAGEIVAVTGALGSGKTRLLGTLFGLSNIAGGSAHLDGKPWHPRRPSDAIAGGVFMAGEDRWRSSLLPPFVPGADIAGTIALPYRRRWFPFGFVLDSRETAVARTAIDALGVRCRGAADTLDLLSGGNQQKVVLGRWQAEPCRLLLLDEPFQGVDVGARRDLIAAIRGNRSEGGTLIATNDVEEAIEAADIVAVMRDHTIAELHDLRSTDPSAFLAAIGAVEASETIDMEEPCHER